jgi:hypothetical protein
MGYLIWSPILKKRKKELLRQYCKTVANTIANSIHLASGGGEVIDVVAGAGY